MTEQLIASNILLDVDQAIQGFNSLACEKRRNTLATVVNTLCSDELSHVLEIVVFLKRYFSSTCADRSEVLIMGVEELLKYLDELSQCPAKSGCQLLVYDLLNDLADIPEQDVVRVTNLKYSLEYVVKEVAKLINQPISDELITMASLFDRVSDDVLKQLFDEAYSDRAQVWHLCTFVEHIPCIDRQIMVCLVLHRKMLMDSARLRNGVLALAYRVRKIKRYTDFPRAKYGEELRKLKLSLPEGVYAIIWNYASISAGQFMVPEARFGQFGQMRPYNGRTFAIRNSDTELFLSEVEDSFCYVEKTEDTWSVEVVRREDDYFYKITNTRTGSSLSPPQDVRLELENDQAGYNLVDFSERSLVAVQKFELNRPSGRCVLQ